MVMEGDPAKASLDRQAVATEEMLAHRQVDILVASLGDMVEDNQAPVVEMIENALQVKHHPFDFPLIEPRMLDDSEATLARRIYGVKEYHQALSVNQKPSRCVEAELAHLHSRQGWISQRC